MSQPAIVFVARHGPRLDAADQNWHLTTPTPYDPPLTYGGFNQSRMLGIRIASLLYAREQSLSNDATTTEPPTPEGVRSQDFARNINGHATQGRKRKRRTHRVVIHTSPFLRCVQTSVAIAAGIAQFAAPTASKSTSSSRARTPFSVMSPRSSVSDHGATTGLLAVPEAKHYLAQEVIRIHESARHKRTKLRIDACLGEWLNPEYFEDITPPPPSAMMVATAKAELMQNDTIDVFTPSITHKSSRSSLWGGGSTGTRPQSRDSALEDWDEFADALPTPRRDRTSSYSSISSADSAGSYRPQSSFLRSETTAYNPPQPAYAVSTSEKIPKGYFAHAKNSCANIDYHWDSSRLPQDWGDGGEYGEEWSLMQRRFRRGLTNIIQWYSQHNADDRGEDALGLDQAEHHDEDLEEQEDLVVVLVTHSAGCNALIGALTGQPVLLDAGTASLTMATRRDASIPTPVDSLRRGSVDIGLNSLYDLKIVASTEHLRPGYDPLKLLIPRPIDMRLRPIRGDSLPGISNPWSPADTGRGSISSALGSILRPHSSSQVPTLTSVPPLTTPEARDSSSLPDSGVTTPTSFTGLWTPPSARTPQLQAQYVKDERRDIFSSLNEGLAMKSSNPPETGSLRNIKHDSPQIVPLRVNEIEKEKLNESDAVSQLRSQLREKPPQSLARGLSQKALWGVRPSGDVIIRNHRDGQKRRWTMSPEDS